VTQARRLTLAALVVVVAAACAGPPWYMGEPLDGTPSIPPTRARLSFRKQRAEARRAHAAGETVLELGALLALDEVERLDDDERARLVSLLERRAAELHQLGRPIAESRDLARVARLAPARGAGLLGERAAAERAAGDAFLGIGALSDARAACARARALGAADLDVRVLALWGPPPSETTPVSTLRAAVRELPLRAVGPFAAVYVARGGADRATLARGLAAAKQEKLEALAVKLAAALDGRRAPEETPHEPVDGGAAGAGGDAAAPGPPDEDASADGARDALDARWSSPTPPPVPVPSDLRAWMLGGVTIAARLLPLSLSHPEILDDLPRAVRWIDLLLIEDATAPDTLALAAYVYGRAGRLGGTERMLMELAYRSPDRAAGLARGAAVWDRVGRPREACAQWIRAARWRDDPEDPTWRTAITCARRDPGAGDAREIRGYVLARARPERRAALAASLDAVDENPL
jgi:hypothetical protein